jgi:REP element-mobilizing transposase RayT
MSPVRYENRVIADDGTVSICRLEDGDMDTVITVSPGHYLLADDLVSMLNQLEMRRAFNDGRVRSMSGASRDNPAQMTGEQHADVLPILQEMAHKVGKEVVRWVNYADHLWALLTPPEPFSVPSVALVRGQEGELSEHFPQRSLPAGMMTLFGEDLVPVRALYGHAMANVRAYETFLGEVEKRIDQEFGHLPQRSEEGPARLGHKQNRNLYVHWDDGEIGGEFLGVVFDPQKAPLLKAALNEYFANHPEETNR